MHCRGKNLVGTLLELLVAGDLELTHASFKVGFILFLDRIQEICLRVLCREAGDLFEFFLLRLDHFLRFLTSPLDLFVLPIE